jgi:NADPH:quinone reductase-like Zn-dependent oxidoreductase
MKAILHTKYGPPEELQLKEVEKPVPKENEVLIKIHATTVTTSDCNFRNLTFVPKLVELPMRLQFGFSKPKYNIIGLDLAGEIEDVGEAVTRFKKGDKVFGTPEPALGTHAEYICMPEDGVLTIKPESMGYEEAAAITNMANTALYFTRDLGKLQAGDKVLINGASGGIGTYAVQLAKYYGAEVTGVCSTSNLELVRSLGADEVIDYTQEDFTKNGKHYDLIFDIVANRSVSDYLLALKPRGHYVACAFNPTSLFLGPLVSKKSAKKAISLSHKPNQNDLLYIKKLFEDGKIVPVIDRSFRLSEVAEALRYLEEGHPRGKVVITVEQDNS